MIEAIAEGIGLLLHLFIEYCCIVIQGTIGFSLWLWNLYFGKDSETDDPNANIKPISTLSVSGFIMLFSVLGGFISGLILGFNVGGIFGALLGGIVGAVVLGFLGNIPRVLLERYRGTNDPHPPT